MKRISHFGLRIFILPMVATLSVCIISAQSRTLAANRSGHDQQFRYVIVHNQIDDSENAELTRRHVEVLLIDSAFSESNLRTLFSLIAKRFPEPHLLYVDVYTNLNQILTPEERDAGVFSEQEDQKLYYWAKYVRSDSAESFRYSPLNDRSGNTLVVLKGRLK